MVHGLFLLIAAYPGTGTFNHLFFGMYRILFRDIQQAAIKKLQYRMILQCFILKEWRFISLRNLQHHRRKPCFLPG